MSIEVVGRDLRQWLDGTVVSVDNSPDLLIVQEAGQTGVKSISIKGTRVRANKSALAGYTVAPARTLMNKDVSLWWPQVGCVNILVEKILCIGIYAYRVADQPQWRRSYHPDMIRTEVPRLWDITQELGYEPSLREASPGNTSFIWALHKPWYPIGLEAALNYLLSDPNHLSVAFDRNIILYFDGQASCRVYYKGAYVADLDVNTSQLICYKGGTMEGRLLTALGEARL